MEDNIDIKEKVTKYICCTRMSSRFSKTAVKDTIFFNKKTFYLAGSEDIDPKSQYKTMFLVKPDTNEKVILYW